MPSLPQVGSLSYGSVDESQVKGSMSSAATAPPSGRSSSMNGGADSDSAANSNKIDTAAIEKSAVVWKRLLGGGGSGEWKNGTLVLRGTHLVYGDEVCPADDSRSSSVEAKKGGSDSSITKVSAKAPNEDLKDPVKGVVTAGKGVSKEMEKARGRVTGAKEKVKKGVATAGKGVSKEMEKARGRVTGAKEKFTGAKTKKRVVTNGSSSPSAMNEVLISSRTLNLATLDWDVKVSAESIASFGNNPNSNERMPLPPPTPYLLSVRVVDLKATSSRVGGSDTIMELQLCFPSLKVQVEWLTALASAIAKASEMTFNAGPGAEESPPTQLNRESTAIPIPIAAITTKQKSPSPVSWSDVAKLLLSLGSINIIIIFCPLWLTVATANIIVILLGLHLLGVYSLPLHPSHQPESEAQQQETTPLIGHTAVSPDDKKTKPPVREITKEETVRFLASLDSTIPMAGSTTVRLQNPTDDNAVGGNRFAGWRPIPSSTFQVRSHGYLSTNKGVKVPSPSELYELVDVDVFESPARVPEIATRVKLPDVPDVEGGQSGSWNSPDLFVISFAVPCEAPSFRSATSDGRGYTITMYYRMKAETRAVLRKITSQQPMEKDDPHQEIVGAVRLFEAWCGRDTNDPKYDGRFKVIINANNMAEVGAPAWISKYNATPFLIKREGVTGYMHKYPHLRCMEFDISLHPFPYLFKQGAAYMKEHYFVKLLASLAFIIEGRADDELPEVLIGEGMQICYPDPAIAIQAEDLFQGTSPKSK